MPHEQTELLSKRLVNQKLTRSGLRDPGEVVSWFGAIQAQDFKGAKWAVGLRGNGLTETAVERAYDEGAILRTHVLRPTWHFVAAADIRWLIALTGPRIIARMGPRLRQLELDSTTLAGSRATLTRALGGGGLTRRQIGEVLQRARIRTTPERLTHLLAVAELEGLVCSGPLRDRQFTYVLTDRRVPAAPLLGRDEALARLAARYFTSHGPATPADFSWWSGLPVREARSAIEMAGPALSRDAVVSDTYRHGRPRSRKTRPTAWLLPNFDEFLVAYKDRAAIFGGRPVDRRDVLANTVVIDGHAVATWRARQGRAAASIAITPRVALGAADMARIRQAGGRYGKFVGQPVEVEP